MPSRRQLLALNPKRVLSVIAMLMLFPSAGVLGGAASASAATIQPTAAELTAIACSTATTCLGVGTTGGPVPSGFVVPITNGIPGSVQYESDAFGLSDVSCPTSTECIAVGHGIVQNNRVGLILTYGEAGTIVQQVPNTPSFYGISCVATRCEIIGTGIAIVVTVANDGTVTVMQHSYSPVNLEDVACSSDTLCFAVGSDVQSSEGVVVAIVNGTFGAEQLVSGSTTLWSIF